MGKRLKVGDRVKAIDALKLEDLRGLEGEITGKDRVGRWMRVRFDWPDGSVYEGWIHGDRVRRVKK